MEPPHADERIVNSHLLFINPPIVPAARADFKTVLQTIVLAKLI
ncbi:MAG: hypothetical protein P8Z79_20720 [Sedimentisphaerales bacterium]